MAAHGGAHGSAQRHAWSRTGNAHGSALAAHRERAWQLKAACMWRTDSAHAAHRQHEGGAQAAQGQRPDNAGMQ